MNITFQQQLNEELLRSEKRRTVILMLLFFVAFSSRLVNMLFLKMGEAQQPLHLFSSVWLFPLLVILFEFLSFLYIQKQIKKKRHQLPLIFRYLNTTIEISLPSIIILLVARQLPGYNILASPAIFVYFIFIILSTLRLNMMLSFFCGTLSTLSYISFSLILYKQFNFDDGGRAAILFLSGIAAGLVARQIRTGIDRSLKETEKRHTVETIFGQQISKEIADSMVEHKGNIESKRMQVAILFIDIRNFTHHVCDKIPEDIVRYQNAFFTIIVNAVEKHGGIVNQFLGDGCMVTFGAPVPAINPAQKAVDTALDIVQQIEQAVSDQQLEATTVGIGIHTGDAVTGNIGTATRSQYSVTGNVVIIASRIEQLNKTFNSRILISGEVAESITHSFIPERIGPVALKGIAQPVELYKLA